MTRIRKLRLVLVGSVLLSLFVGGIFFVYGRTKNTLLADYPDSPFEKLPENAFRFYHDEEIPSRSDKPAIKAYIKAFRARNEYIQKRGSEKDVTPAERKALDAYWNAKYVRGLEQSETILRENPQSVPAMFVRANALANGEANPPAALHQLQILRRYLEECGRENPANAIAREWYVRSLFQEMDVLERLGRDAEVVRCVEIVEQVIGPQPRMKVWPMFRLNRLDEAEAMIVETEKTGKWIRSALNSRGTLELQRFHRTPTYDIYKKMAALEPTGEIYQSNFGEAALVNFRFAEAETAYLKAAKLAGPHSSTSWYTNLAALYLRQGRLAESIDSLKKGQAQRARRHPSTWQYDRAQVQITLANMLMATGKIADAERIARRAYETPDRRRSNNQNEADSRLLTSLTFWSILQSRVAELKEVEATEPLFGQSYRTRKQFEAEIWSLEKSITKLLDERLLRTTFSPLLGCSPEGLLKILPRGVALTAIQTASDSDDHTSAVPYYDGYRAEVAYHNGQFDEAARQAQAALEKLPAEAEKVHCCRLQTILAMAELKRGEINKCAGLLDPVLDGAPVVLRMLNARIPVNVESDASPAARQLAALLAKSPRLQIDPAGFRIRIRSNGDQLTLEMFRLNNVRHTEQAAKIVDGELHTSVVEVYQKLHDKLSTPAVSLDQQTINSLDGTPVSIAERAEIDQHVNLYNRGE